MREPRRHPPGAQHAGRRPRLPSGRLSKPVVRAAAACLVALLGAAGASGRAAAQQAAAFDITTPKGEPRTIDFTTDEATWMSVDLSPDGRWVAFDLLGHVYRMPASGGAAESLTQGSGMALNYQPAISPDGRTIAFISDRGGQNNLWLMDADGSNPRAVHLNDDLRMAEPRWTPDGEYVVVRQMSFSGQGFFAWGLWMYHRDGGSGIELLPYSTEAPGFASFSPDGRYLYHHVFLGEVLPFGGADAMTGDWQLRRLEPATGDVAEITAGRAAQQSRATSGGAFAPAVSPDGRWLAFARRIPDATLEYRGHVFGPRTALFLRDLETGAERLAMDPVEWDQTQEITRMPPVLPRYAWTPDGRAILISQGGRLRRLDVETGDVATIPFEARVQRVISEQAYARNRLERGPVQVRFPRWHTASPDGRRLAFQAVGRVWVQDLPGGTPRRLTAATDGGFEYAPAWSPDGSTLAFTTFSAPEGGHVWTVPAAGGPPTRLTTRPGEYVNPAWSPDGGELLVSRGSGATFRGRTLGDNAWYEIVRLPVGGGEPVTVARAAGAGAGGRIVQASWGPDGRVFFPERGRLVSVTREGTDRRVHLEVPNAGVIAPSPDGRRVAFVTGSDVYVAPFPYGLLDEPATVRPDGGPVKATRLTHGGGLFVRWRDGSTLEFGSGPSYFVHDLRTGATDSTEIRLTVPRAGSEGTIALTGARLITLEDEGVIENGTVVATDGRITCVGRCDTAGADRVIDAAGKTIMPGWVDVHGHHHREYEGLIPARGFEHAIYLAYGVTTTRDPASSALNLFPAKELVEAGLVVGPRIFGTAETMTPGLDPFKHGIASAEDAEREVARRASWGAETLKDYLQPRRAIQQWIVAAGREHGLLVTSEGGNFGVEHNVGLAMDGHTGWEHALTFMPIYSDAARFFGRAGIHYSPTVVVGGSSPWSEEYFFQRADTWKDPKMQRWLPWRQLVPHARRRMLRPETDYAFTVVAEGVKDILEAGGNAAIGSHGQQHGVASHWETWMYASALGPLEALRVASMGGARFLGLQDELGSLRAGKLADLVVLNANPLDAIENTADIAFVMKDGVLYEGMTLDEVWPRQRPFGDYYWVDEEMLKADTLPVIR